MPERKVTYSEIAPLNPNVGDSWIHTITRVEKLWNGTGWMSLGGGAQLVISETEVFNGVAPGAWVDGDLDLSGIIGVNPALVLLKIDGAADLNAVAVRKKGDTDEFYDAAVEANAYGCALGHHDAGVHLVLIVATNDSGVIQWMVETPGDATVDIIAYIK